MNTVHQRALKMLVKAVTNIFRDPSVLAIRELLSAVELPTDDVLVENENQNTSHDGALSFFGLKADDTSGFSAGSSELAGVIGIEIYHEVALLRSLAVSPEHRGRGLGSILVAHLERFAYQSGVTSIYLLTTTAEAYFAHRGYDIVLRTRAPSEIRETNEFSSICPESAILMVKHS